MLQQLLKEELGKKFIEKKELPDYLETSLSSTRKMRPYQEECLRYFLSYMEDYDNRLQRPHLLFHMATGSGKTLIMAATMLYLYEQGYRNFLFFVDTNNIVEKTKDNFLNAASSKYLLLRRLQSMASVWRYGKLRTFKVHRLIASTFASLLFKVFTLH